MFITWLLEKIIGTKYERELKNLQPIVNNINHHYSEILTIFEGFKAESSEAEYDEKVKNYLQERTKEFKKKIQDYLQEDYADLKELKIEKNSINDFITTYKYCALSRNLHILGAFSFLSLKKNKQYFKNYIPAALKSLNNIIRSIPEKEILYLKETESKISRSL